MTKTDWRKGKGGVTSRCGLQEGYNTELQSTVVSSDMVKGEGGGTFVGSGRVVAGRRSVGALMAEPWLLVELLMASSRM